MTWPRPPAQAVPPTLSIPGIQALALSEEVHEMGTVCGYEARMTIARQGSALALSVIGDDAPGWNALVASDGTISRERT